ncbi:MAG: cell division protein FtsQ/DivIB [Rhizobiales bacterium]|nr:cell division protein FtsQ/DivIB [Hyphomicrobiales bacterium]
MPPGTVTRHTLLTAHALALRAADTAVTAGRTTWRFVRRRPQRAGAIAAAVLVVAAAGYGLRRGEHSPIPQNFFADLGDTVANAAGFKIATLTVTGRAQLSEAELLAAGGITTNTSLLLLDVAAVRQKLESSPWIAHATVRKLYPNHLEIAIEERQAFALWQKNGQISLIAVDGTVLAPVEAGSAPRLPLVVGPGAAAKAHDFLGMLDRYPVLRDDMRAAILVADRRWNLRMKSGLDIRLPEEGVDAALDTLMALDREKKLLTRDLTAIDLRIPERVTVRLSDEAAQARENAIKEREKKKRKGGDA